MPAILQLLEKNFYLGSFPHYPQPYQHITLISVVDFLLVHCFFYSYRPQSDFSLYFNEFKSNNGLSIRVVCTVLSTLSTLSTIHSLCGFGDSLPIFKSFFLCYTTFCTAKVSDFLYRAGGDLKKWETPSSRFQEEKSWT